MANFSPWVLVPLLAIIASVIVSVTSTRARQHAASSELGKRVEELERRVSSIERST
jgi:type II secretory pathway component PulJ